MKLMILIALFVIYFISLRQFGGSLNSTATRKEWYIFWLKSSFFSGAFVALLLTGNDLYTKSGFFEKSVPDAYEFLSALSVYFLSGLALGLIINAGFVFKYKQIIK